MAGKKEEVTSPTGIVFTEETLKSLIETIMKQANEQTLEAVREIKKPSEREQRKLDEELKIERQNRVRKVRETVEIERVERVKQFHCQHIKAAEGVHERAHAFRGQVNNDNCCRPLCVRCFKSFPAFKVSDEQLKSGMNLGAIKDLTAEILYRAHMQSFPNCKDCVAGNCAVRDMRELKQGRLDPKPDVLPDGKIRAEQLTA